MEGRKMKEGMKEGSAQGNIFACIQAIDELLAPRKVALFWPRI
jgi:hypothetical protein